MKQGALIVPNNTSKESTTKPRLEEIFARSLRNSIELGFNDENISGTKLEEEMMPKKMIDYCNYTSIAEKMITGVKESLIGIDSLPLANFHPSKLQNNESGSEDGNRGDPRIMYIVLYNTFRNELDTIDIEILKKIKRSHFWPFCELNVIKRQYWGKMLKVDLLMSYSKSISGPLLKLPNGMDEMAKKSFAIIKIIITRKLPRAKLIEYMKKFIKPGVKNCSQFRNEMYFQVIKQVRSNPDKSCCMRAWTLMGVMGCYLYPSQDMIFFILNYIYYVVLHHQERDVKEWAIFILKNIVKGYMTNGRNVLPSSEEIDRISKRQKLHVLIHFFTEGYMAIEFDHLDSIKDILKKICRRLEIPMSELSNFGIFEIGVKASLREECYIENFVKLADVLASWEHEKEFRKKQLTYNEADSFKLYFKIRFFVWDLELVLKNLNSLERNSKIQGLKIKREVSLVEGFQQELNGKYLLYK